MSPNMPIVAVVVSQGVTYAIVDGGTGCPHTTIDGAKIPFEVLEHIAKVDSSDDGDRAEEKRLLAKIIREVRSRLARAFRARLRRK